MFNRSFFGPEVENQASWAVPHAPYNKKRAYIHWAIGVSGDHKLAKPVKICLLPVGPWGMVEKVCSSVFEWNIGPDPCSSAAGGSSRNAVLTMCSTAAAQQLLPGKIRWSSKPFTLTVVLRGAEGSEWKKTMHGNKPLFQATIKPVHLIPVSLLRMFPYSMPSKLLGKVTPTSSPIVNAARKWKSTKKLSSQMCKTQSERKSPQWS